MRASHDRNIPLAYRVDVYTDEPLTNAKEPPEFENVDQEIETVRTAIVHTAITTAAHASIIGSL
jgi:hypothetical protein